MLVRLLTELAQAHDVDHALPQRADERLPARSAPGLEGELRTPPFSSQRTSHSVDCTFPLPRGDRVAQGYGESGFALSRSAPLDRRRARSPGSCAVAAVSAQVAGDVYGVAVEPVG